MYECFPDLVRTASGRLVVMYRESDWHVAREYSQVVARTSDDDGQTWGDRIIVDEGPRAAGVKKEAYWSYNCPRMRVLSDGRILAVCDQIWHGEEDARGEFAPDNWLWWSDDQGETWTSKHRTGIRSIMPDKPCELADGTLLVATERRNPETGKMTEIVHRSHDGGITWKGPSTIADDGKYNHGEGNLLLMPDGTLICYMREDSMRCDPGFKCFSDDGGVTWEGPYPTLMVGCHRPTAGLLASGRVLVTYREHLALTFGAQRLCAYLEDADSALKRGDHERVIERQTNRIMMLDYDNNARPDTGYSGWVQLPDGRIYSVNYIKREAPEAWIRAVVFRESDLILD